MDIEHFFLFTICNNFLSQTLSNSVEFELIIKSLCVVVEWLCFSLQNVEGVLKNVEGVLKSCRPVWQLCF